MEEKIRAWIYVRVGSDACGGDPIGQQAALLTEYAEKHDIEVVGWSFDKCPGIDLGRDGLGKAIRAIEGQQANARIFRDTKELASFYLKLKAMGAKLISATEERLEEAMEILAEEMETV